MEHHADDLTKQVHQLIDRVFITKYDKNDLASLVNKLDSIIDKMREASESEIAFPRDGSYKTAEQLTLVIQEMIELVRLLLEQLLYERKPNVQLHVEIVKAKEEQADELRRAAVKALYVETDAKSFIAWRDVLSKLEQVTDNCQDVADIVSSMSRK
ncbi:MAG: DUF47 family protein [Candidatus Poribacteria bacterium]|nr:DUF47 family protein [Candidatus Poribacteria bacterium]